MCACSVPLCLLRLCEGGGREKERKREREREKYCIPLRLFFILYFILFLLLFSLVYFSFHCFIRSSTQSATTSLFHLLLWGGVFSAWLSTLLKGSMRGGRGDEGVDAHTHTHTHTHTGPSEMDHDFILFSFVCRRKGFMLWGVACTKAVYSGLWGSLLVWEKGEGETRVGWKERGRGVEGS